jgi:hypothetical protein
LKYRSASSGVTISRYKYHVNKEANNKKALKIAEEFERAAKTKRTNKQVQKVLGRLHEEVSGEPAIRASFSRYLNG